MGLNVKVSVGKLQMKGLSGTRLGGFSFPLMIHEESNGTAFLKFVHCTKPKPIWNLHGRRTESCGFHLGVILDAEGTPTWCGVFGRLFLLRGRRAFNVAACFADKGAAVQVPLLGEVNNQVLDQRPHWWSQDDTPETPYLTAHGDNQ